MAAISLGMRPKIDWPSWRDAAVDDDEMRDALRYAVGDELGDQAAEAVADEHDVAQIVLLEVGDRVGDERFVVEMRAKLGRALADPGKAMSARVVTGSSQLLDHELR